jgi:hypothetical protein
VFIICCTALHSTCQTKQVAHAVELTLDAPAANSSSSSDGHKDLVVMTAPGGAAAATAAAAAAAALDQKQQHLAWACPPGYSPAPFSAPLCVKRYYRVQDTCFDAPACPAPYNATDAPPRCLDAKVTSVIAGLLALRRAGIALPSSIQPPLDRAQPSPSPAAVTTALLAAHSSSSIGIGGVSSDGSSSSGSSSSSTSDGGSLNKADASDDHSQGESAVFAGTNTDAADDDDGDDGDGAPPQAPPIQLAREAFTAHAAASLGPLARGTLLGPSRKDAFKLADYAAKLTSFDWMSMPNFNRLYEAVNRAVRAVPAPIVSASRAVAPACLSRCCHTEAVVDTAFAWPVGRGGGDKGSGGTAVG